MSSEDPRAVGDQRPGLETTAAALKAVVKEVRAARADWVEDEQSAVQRRVRRASQEALQDISSQTVRTYKVQLKG
eukprot:SAG22_NODE_137_length_18056_cov_9.974940_4_plen_75_part_00